MTTNIVNDADVVFDPMLHHVSRNRLWRKPAQGKIVSVQPFNGLDIALYKSNEQSPDMEFRVLMPECPILQKQVELTRVEGGHKSVVFKRWNNPDFESDSLQDIAPLFQAHAELVRWSKSAPIDGSYHKCDFKITWENKKKQQKHYSGRFDLQYGGTASGLTIRDQVVNTLLYYAGLLSTPDTFTAHSTTSCHEVKRQSFLHSIRFHKGPACEMLAHLEL